MHHAHWFGHVWIGKKELSVHHHGKEQSDRESRFGPPPFHHADHRQGQRNPTHRTQDLKWNEPRRVSQHGSHLRCQTAWVNPTVILTHRRISPSDEIAKAEIENQIYQGDHGELPCPFASGHDEPRIDLDVDDLEFPLPEKESHKHREWR